MGKETTTPNWSGENNKELPVTQEKILTTQENLSKNITDLKLPEWFLIGDFQFEKEWYKKASINEDIIMKLKELIQESVNKSLDEKDESASIVAEAIRRLTNKDIWGKTPSVNAAVSEILALDKHNQAHGGQSLNRLDFQNILNLLLINENSYTTLKEGTLINPRLGIMISALIKNIRLLDDYWYDSVDDIPNKKWEDFKEEFKEIKRIALWNIRSAATIFEAIALAKKNTWEHKE